MSNNKPIYQNEEDPDMHEDILEATQYILSFYYVAREASLHKAALKLDTSEQNLSKRIKKLNEIIGIDLIRTDRTGSHLTDKGRQFYNEFMPIFKELSDHYNDWLSLGKKVVSKVMFPQPFACASRDFERYAMVRNTDTLKFNFYPEKNIPAPEWISLVYEFPRLIDLYDYSNFSGSIMKTGDVKSIKIEFHGDKLKYRQFYFDKDGRIDFSINLRDIDLQPALKNSREICFVIQDISVPTNVYNNCSIVVRDLSIQ